MHIQRSEGEWKKRHFFVVIVYLSIASQRYGALSRGIDITCAQGSRQRELLASSWKGFFIMQKLSAAVGSFREYSEYSALHPL